MIVLEGVWYTEMHQPNSEIRNGELSNIYVPTKLNRVRETGYTTNLVGILTAPTTIWSSNFTR